MSTIRVDRTRIQRAVLMLGSVAVVLALVAGVLWIVRSGTNEDVVPTDRNEREEAVESDRDLTIACFDLRAHRLKSGVGHVGCPGVRLSIKLPKRHIRSGDSFEGKLLFTNNRDGGVYINIATSPVGASFHNLKTGKRVGGNTFISIGTGWIKTVPSGKSAGISLVVTAIRGCCPPKSGLPPGRYELRATAESCLGGPCRRIPYAATTIRVKKATDD